MYSLLCLLVLTILFFFPVQIDVRINYIVWGFSIFLLPIFIPNFKADIKNGSLIALFFLFFLLASLLSTAFSIDVKRSLLMLFTYASYFVIFTSIHSIFPTRKSKKLLVNCYLLIVSILALISLYHTLILHYVNRAKEGVSFMWIYYAHNHLSALLVFAIPLSLYLLKIYWHRKIINVVLLVNCYLLIITLFLTFSRASLISLIIAGIAAVLLFRFIPKRKIFLLLAICSIAIIIFSFILANAKQIGVSKPDVFNSTRTIYWKTAIVNGLAHPMTGTGLDTFRTLSYEARVLKTHYAHNFFFQMLSDAGILGFISSIGLIGSVLWKGVKKLKTPGKLTIKQQFFYSALFVGILASTLNTLVDFDWQLPTVFLLFWIISGIMLFSEEKK